MKKRSFAQLLALLTVLTGTLVTSVSPVFAKETGIKESYVNHRKPLKGGTLKMALPSDESFKGIFVTELGYDAATDALVQVGTPGLFRKDKNGKYVKGGLVDATFDRKNKTVSLKVAPKARWSDGYPVTARDLLFVYELVANKDSTSAYYSESFETIEGMKEYHEGKADHISGMELKNDKELVIHFKEMQPAMEYVDSGFIYNDAQPYHYLKDIPFDKLAQNDRVRQHPLFYGPYKIKKLVEGESIEWVPNKYWAFSKPKLDKIVEELVPTAQVVEAMRAHKYDVILDESEATYVKTKNLSDWVTLGKLSYGLQYMGFRVGNRAADGRSVLDKKLVTNDRSLRLAMAYAMNTQEVIKKYGHGLQKWANSMVSPAYGAYHDNKIKPFKQDLSKANKLLDQAGFKRGKDGYRTRPDGKKLTVRVLAATQGKGFAAVLQNYLQLWKKIGVRAQLVNGKTVEFNSFQDLLHSNYDKFDLWFGSWQLSGEPSVAATAAYSPLSAFNHGHFATKENTELLNSLNSQKAFNSKYRIAQMHKWQAYMRKEAWVVPLAYDYDLSAVGKNVKGMTEDQSSQYTVWDKVCLTK